MRGLAARLRATPSWQVTLAAALLVLGFLVAAQLRSEGPRVRYTSQERAPLIETVLSLQRDQDALKARILQLNEQIRDLQRRGEGSAALVAELNREIEAARLAAGLVAVQGPGLVLQLTDASGPLPPGANPADVLVHSDDIRTLVEELWLAGAEAIAVNGERVTVSTAILDIGGSVLVNSAYLAPPYQIAAIGPPGLYRRLTASPSFVAFVVNRVDAFGLGLSFAEPERVLIPAYAGTVTLRYARPEPSPSPGGS
ncbi:MAG: hypothetical protein C4343_04310 [Chloroflexota bacterium]